MIKVWKWGRWERGRIRILKNLNPALLWVPQIYNNDRVWYFFFFVYITTFKIKLSYPFGGYVVLKVYHQMFIYVFLRGLHDCDHMVVGSIFNNTISAYICKIHCEVNMWSVWSVTCVRWTCDQFGQWPVEG
jgi:hypothetical protein